MALKFPNAGYAYREHIQDPHLKGALDDLANQVAASHIQGNFSTTGVVLPPTTPIQLNVSAANGTFTAKIIHPNPPVGTRWRLQYTQDPSFQTGVIEEELATPNWQKVLPSTPIYFRTAAKFLTSAVTNWVYYGTSNKPTAIGYNTRLA